MISDIFIYIRLRAVFKKYSLDFGVIFRVSLILKMNSFVPVSLQTKLVNLSESLQFPNENPPYKSINAQTQFSVLKNNQILTLKLLQTRPQIQEIN